MTAVEWSDGAPIYRQLKERVVAMLLDALDGRLLGRDVDAEGIVTANFRQHTSRSVDPQLHTHVVVANRVRSPDGRWLALHARLIASARAGQRM